MYFCVFFFFQAEDGIRDTSVTGVQTCALPISRIDDGPDAFKTGETIKLSGIAMVGLSGLKRIEYWLRPDTGTHGKLGEDRKSTRLNSSHRCISYAVFCLKKKKKNRNIE